MLTSVIMALNAAFQGWKSVGSPLKTSGWHLGRFCWASPTTICWFTDVNRDFKQLTTTTPKWTTGSEDAQFAPTAHAIDETSVVVHLWTTVDTRV